MIKQTAGKIFLADQRGMFETPKLRRYSTFNFGDYSHPHKVPAGNLTVVNEESLAPLHQIVLDVEQPSHVLLVPVTGEVHFTHEKGTTSVVDVGQVLVATLSKDTTFRLANPYEADTISYLQIWVNAAEPVREEQTQLLNYDFNFIQSHLAEIVPYSSGKTALSTDYPFSLGLGCFAGREEVTYFLQKPDAMFFAFVVAGAFEVEGRLLHQNDGLALWNTSVIELEALSENVVILVVEVVNQTGTNQLLYSDTSSVSGKRLPDLCSFIETKPLFIQT